MDLNVQNTQDLIFELLVRTKNEPNIAEKINKILFLLDETGVLAGVTQPGHIRKSSLVALQYRFSSTEVLIKASVAIDSNFNAASGKPFLRIMGKTFVLTAFLQQTETF